MRVGRALAHTHTHKAGASAGAVRVVEWSWRRTGRRKLACMSRYTILRTPDGVVGGRSMIRRGQTPRRNGNVVTRPCWLRMDADGRFPRGYCPYHLLHNLLGGHYSRAPQCTAEPYKDVACRHGSPSRGYVTVMGHITITITITKGCS